MRSKIFCIIGPDRVGKSTLIEQMQALTEVEYSTKTMHFTGPQRGHLTPIDQYLDPLRAIYPSQIPEFLIWDRGPQEVLFYEQYRRAAFIPGYYCHVMEDVMQKIAQTFIVLVEQSWDVVKPRHESELAQEGHGEPYTLEERRREHEDYYDFMYKLEKVSSLNWVHVNKQAYEENPDCDLASDLIFTYGFNYSSKETSSYLPSSER